MTQYLLSIYQPEGQAPPEVMDRVARDLHVPPCGGPAGVG